MKSADIINSDTAKNAGVELVANVEQLVDRIGLTAAVVDIPSLEQAVLDREQIGAAEKRVIEFFRPLKSAAHQLHKTLCDRENDVLVPLRRLDQAKRDAIADFNQLAIRQRQQREQELAADRKREADAAALSEAAALEQQGDHGLARAVMAEAVARPAPVVVLADEVREIVSFRRTWHWRLVNEALVERPFLCLDTKKLDKYATAMQQSARAPGIEFFYKDTPTR